MKAIIELEDDKCLRSYKLLGSVLEYGVKRIDRAWALTFRTIKLFRRIGERLGYQFEIQTQDDLRQGEVIYIRLLNADFKISGTNFPTYRWTVGNFKCMAEDPVR